MKGTFCDIKKFTPTERTTSALDELSRVTKMSKHLETAMIAAPFLQVFSGRGSTTGSSLTTAGINVTTYEWEVFSSAIQSIPDIQKSRIENIAYNEYILSAGEDQKVWRCIYNAL